VKKSSRSLLYPRVSSYESLLYIILLLLLQTQRKEALIMG